MSYSSYWRVNKSRIEAFELANALKPLRKIVSRMNVDAEVVWAGMPSGRSNRIELPPPLAQEEFPIPSENMDILTGLTIHQAMHIAENSEHAWGYLSQMLSRLEKKTNLAKLADAGEDIHVDAVAIGKGLIGDYVRKARAWWWKNNQLDYGIGYANPDSLFGIWMNIMLDEVFRDITPKELEDMRNLTEELLENSDIHSVVRILCRDKTDSVFQVYRSLVSAPIDYLDPLHMLLCRTPQIIFSDSVSRALCYQELWGKLERFFYDWEVVIAEAESSEERQGFQSSADSYGNVSGGGGGELSPDMANDVQQLMDSEIADITASIEAAFSQLGTENERYLLFPVVTEHSEEPLIIAPNNDLVRSLRDVFRLHLEETLRINRGLRFGRLDSRRLSRVHTTGLVFKQKQYFKRDEYWFNISLLLDASGSTQSSWNLIESTYAAVAEALSGEDIKLDVFAYRESSGVCEVSKLLHSGKLFSVKPAGSTPTGEAIVAAALLMPPGDRRLIVHVTDGLWNVGIDTWYGLEFCKQREIELVTIGCSKALKALDLQYEDSYEVMEGIEELPEVMGALLRRKLVGRKWGCAMTGNDQKSRCEV